MNMPLITFSIFSTAIPISCLLTILRHNDQAHLPLCSGFWSGGAKRFVRLLQTQEFLDMLGKSIIYFRMSGNGLFQAVLGIEINIMSSSMPQKAASLAFKILNLHYS